MTTKMESFKEKLNKFYVQQSLQIGIFKVSCFILGKDKFSIRFEISWGWTK